MLAAALAPLLPVTAAEKTATAATAETPVWSLQVAHSQNIGDLQSVGAVPTTVTTAPPPTLPTILTVVLLAAVPPPILPPVLSGADPLLAALPAALPSALPVVLPVSRAAPWSCPFCNGTLRAISMHDTSVSKVSTARIGPRASSPRIVARFPWTRAENAAFRFARKLKVASFKAMLAASCQSGPVARASAGSLGSSRVVVDNPLGRGDGDGTGRCSPPPPPCPGG